MDIESILIIIPGVVLGLTLHEFCHAFCAWKLGDSTARDQGRLTFNPLKHIDFIGFLFIIFAGFGWAKPVQFNPDNLRKYRRDKALIAAAGPLSNLALGILLALLVRILLNNFVELYFSNVIFEYFLDILYTAAILNFGLFVFNLIPIPPLDGSHIVFSGLNLKFETEERIRKFGIPVLFLIIIVQNTTGIRIIPIDIAARAIMSLFIS